MKSVSWIDKLRLVVITSSDLSGHLGIAGFALQGGARAIQLRDKELPDRKFLGIAKQIKSICAQYDALFFINDRVDIAMIVGSDGIHIGVDDIPVLEARMLLGEETIIGYSPANIEDARRAIEDGANYLGVGSVYPSSTKLDAGLPIGIDGLSLFTREGIAPVIGVGGINATNAAEVIEAGACGVAVSSAVAQSNDGVQETRRILDSIRGALSYASKES
ncbi:MAG: thiamine phosphate synthase [Actinomycetota bacterium]|nr:thiamine phosphate synthase [Actinomycetota bacterium]